MTEKIRTDIKPSEFQTKNHWWDSFQKHEREVSARLLVKFAQERSGDTWDDINKKELNARFEEVFWLNGLDRLGYIIVNKNGTLSFTSQFIFKCWEAESTKEQS